jgi:hypothetical protein
VLSHKEQIHNLLINKIVITPDILFVDFQARGRSEEMFNLVDALDPFVFLHVVNGIEWTHPWFVHFPWSFIIPYCCDGLAACCEFKTFSSHIAQSSLQFGPQPLLFDLRRAVQRAASAASQNDVAGARNRNFMADINDSARSGRVDDTGWWSRVSAVIRGAHASYSNRTAGGGIRGVNALRIGTCRNGFRLFLRASVACLRNRQQT